MQGLYRVGENGGGGLHLAEEPSRPHCQAPQGVYHAPVTHSSHVTSPAGGRPRPRRPPLDLPLRSDATSTRRAGDIVRVARRAASACWATPSTATGPRSRCACSRAARARCRPALWRRPSRAGRRVPRIARHRRHRLPARPRRGRPAAVARRRSLRRLPRGPDPVAGHRPPAARRSSGMLVELLRPRGMLARNDPQACGCSRGSSRRSSCSTARCPQRVDGRAKGRVRLRRRPVARPEDRAVPRPAREPRGRGPLRARPGPRLLQLQRRLRAAPGAAVRVGARHRHLGRRDGAHSRERRG